MKRERISKILVVLLALVMVISISACGKSGNNGEKKEKKAKNKDEMSVCLASEPQTLDPAKNSALDGATMLCHLFSGLAKWEKSEDGIMVVVPDCAKELTEPVKNDDGTVTYTYTLKDGLKWSDGKDLTADDFVFSWQRAVAPATASDYNYMYEVIDGYDAIYPPGEEKANPDAKLNVKATDAKTIEVTLTNEVNYWNELLAFPVYFPVREDVVSNDKWATEAKTYIGNGPYKMAEWDHKSKIVLEKNENYHDPDSVKMPKLNFFLSDDANNMLSNFKTGDWQLIDDVPTQEIEKIKNDKQYKDSFHIEGQIGTYYVNWNINESLLPADSDLTGVEAEKANEEIRNAICKLFDRTHIVQEIAQGGQVPASSFVAMGIKEADGKEDFYKNAGDSSDYDGYFDPSQDAVGKNYDEAIEVLKKYYEFDEGEKKFTNFPDITYLYNTSESHQAIGEYLQAQLAGVGINMSMENQEWNTFLETRKKGDYTMARNGWVADHTDPISFLDMWTTNSGNNDVQFGREGNAELKMYNLDLTDVGSDLKVENGTWAETYDVLISKIKKEEDVEKRYKMMHKAEDLVMSTGCICPLYFYTDLYMLDPDIQGFYANPLGYKYFMGCTYAE